MGTSLPLEKNSSMEILSSADSAKIIGTDNAIVSDSFDLHSRPSSSYRRRKSKTLSSSDESIGNTTISTIPEGPEDDFDLNKPGINYSLKQIDLNEVFDHLDGYEQWLKSSSPTYHSSPVKQHEGSALNLRSLEVCEPRSSRKSFLLQTLAELNEEELDEKVYLEEMLRKSATFEADSSFDTYEECLAPEDHESCRSLPDNFKFDEPVAEPPLRNRVITGLKRFSFIK